MVVQILTKQNPKGFKTQTKVLSLLLLLPLAHFLNNFIRINRQVDSIGQSLSPLQLQFDTYNSRIIKVSETIPGTKIPMVVHTWMDNDVNNWITENEGYQVIIWETEMVNLFVKKWYSADIYHKFLRMNTPNMKNDLFKFMVLDKYGGVFADAGVKNLKSIDSWIVPNVERTKSTDHSKNVNFLVGLQGDSVNKISLHLARDFQWSTWVLASSPNNPILQTHLKTTLAISLIPSVKLNHAGIFTDVLNYYLHSIGINWYEALRPFEELLLVEDNGFNTLLLPDSVMSNDSPANHLEEL